MKYKKDNKLPNTKNVRRKTNPAGVTTHIPPKSSAATSTSSNSKSNYTNTTANNSTPSVGNTTPSGGMNSLVEHGGMNTSGMNPQQNSRANSTGPNNNVVSSHHGVGSGSAGAIGGPLGSGSSSGGGGGGSNTPHSHFGQVPHVPGGAHNNCLPPGGAPPQLKQEQPYGLTSLWRLPWGYYYTCSHPSKNVYPFLNDVWIHFDFSIKIYFKIVRKIKEEPTDWTITVVKVQKFFPDNV